MQDRVQVFNKEGQLLTYLGGHGNLPGQFAALCGITIDKNNRVFTSEQYPGRVQQFRYVTEAEAAAEKARRDAELGKRARNGQGGRYAGAETASRRPVQGFCAEVRREWFWLSADG